ncbi:hypothetical protein SAMN05192563_101571 [Paraburkholderia aspalathi]|uniref:Uncharacterized protein n=1 Tax=Paraburkholderia aspalathi TaxID=1324617 RepID=A0A1I7E9J1_9BURK|nr:hypothetical protein SAMN05192563_101571 [Paraburkholderia aspalathi]
MYTRLHASPLIVTGDDDGHFHDANPLSTSVWI